jgi:hypothetical protein
MAGTVAGALPVAMASSGPYLFAVLSGSDSIVKIGTGFGPSVRGKVYAVRPGVLKRLVVEGGSALFSLEHTASLWLGVVGSTVVVRESSMKAGVLVAYNVDTLADAGVLNQVASSSSSSSSNGGRSSNVEVEEAKGAESERLSKIAASTGTTASTSGIVGLGPAALAVLNDTSFVVRCEGCRVYIRNCFPSFLPSFLPLLVPVLQFLLGPSHADCVLSC